MLQVSYMRQIIGYADVSEVACQVLDSEEGRVSLHLQEPNTLLAPLFANTDGISQCGELSTDLQYSGTYEASAMTTSGIWLPGGVNSTSVLSWEAGPL